MLRSYAGPGSGSIPWLSSARAINPRGDTATRRVLLRCDSGRDRPARTGRKSERPTDPNSGHGFRQAIPPGDRRAHRAVGDGSGVLRFERRRASSSTTARVLRFETGRCEVIRNAGRHVPCGRTERTSRNDERWPIPSSTSRPDFDGCELGVSSCSMSMSGCAEINERPVTVTRALSLSLSSAGRTARLRSSREN